MFSPYLGVRTPIIFGPYYVSEKQILSFYIEVGVSSLEHEEMVTMKACLFSERVTMRISFNPLSPYFYFYLPLIKNMGFSSPFPFDLGGSEYSQYYTLILVPQQLGFY